MQGHLISIEQNLLEEYLKDSSLLKDLITNKTESDQITFLELGDSWDGVQEILNSDPNEDNEYLKRALMSYKLIDQTQDLGYGPAHYHTNTQVIKTNEQLQILNLDEIKSKKEIYFPFTFDDKYRVEGNIEIFQVFLEFFNKTAESNRAIIFYIT